MPVSAWRFPRNARFGSHVIIDYLVLKIEHHGGRSPLRQPYNRHGEGPTPIFLIRLKERKLQMFRFNRFPLPRAESELIPFRGSGTHAASPMP
jgi:hypothetical protein